MWDAETIKDYRIEISEEKKQIVSTLIDKYCVPTKGIILIFDDNDYDDYPNPLWQKSRALHINVKDYGTIEWSPLVLRSIMESSQFTNIIWLSKRVCLSEEIEFAWTLAHELRHLQVDLKCSLITGIGRFLYKQIFTSKIDVSITFDSVPTEFDADIMSLRVLLSLYDEERLKKYMDYKIQHNERPMDFQMISKYNLSENYNVFSETINMLRKYESQLEKIDVQFTKHIEYTFEDVYAELSKYA